MTFIRFICKDILRHKVILHEMLYLLADCLCNFLYGICTSIRLLGRQIQSEVDLVPWLVNLVKLLSQTILLSKMGFNNCFSKVLRHIYRLLRHQLLVVSVF